MCFHSLPTGKHIQSKKCSERRSANVFVSIPFQRESISKVTLVQVEAATGLKFPFPSNGKAYPKAQTVLQILANSYLSFHSLPTGKHIQSNIRRVSKKAKVMCFHSLPTGKHIQRAWYHVLSRVPKRFPFPSNGKAYPKLSGKRVTHIQLGFHSLPTGKHIQRLWHRRPTRRTGVSFHSLPTGKHIQRERL